MKINVLYHAGGEEVSGGWLVWKGNKREREWFIHIWKYT
jgi:hypothetical protein